MTELQYSPRWRRFVVSVLLLPMLLLLAFVWTWLGCLSMRALGRVLEQTGRNLQEYHW